MAARIAELERLNTELAAAIEVKDAALSELVDLMEDFYAGKYRPDSFTSQPARNALSLSPPDLLAKRDQMRDAALLRFLASKTRKSAHAAEIEAIAKRRKSGEWEPELEVK